MSIKLAMIRIREFLVAQTDLTAVTGQRIYASRSLPPEYHPDPSNNDPDKVEKGPGILFWVRGGDRNYSETIIAADTWIECYGADELTAQNLAELVLYNAINHKRSKYIMWAQQDIEPQLAQSPDTDWLMSVVPYTIRVRLIN